MLYGTLAATITGAADIHPLGYYTLLWVWIRAFGQSLVVVRSFSILAGIITVYFAYLFSEKLFDGRFASVAAVFVALSPFHIHYSQEIRMYSFLAMWLMIATYAYLRGSTQRSWRWWALFSVTAVLAQYTHNLAALYLIPLAITPFLQRDRKNMLTVTLAGFGAILLYFPWLLQLPSQITKISNAYWVERPGFAKIFTLFLTFVTNLPLPDGWLLPALFIALSAISIGIVQTLRVSNKNAAALWLLYLSFAPPILLFLVSQWIPIYIERALLPSGVIFCIWLAWAMFSTSLPKMIRNILVGMLVIGAAMGMIQHVTYRDFPYAPYQELDTLIRKRKASEDVVIHSNKLSIIPAVYYDPTLPQLFIADKRRRKSWDWSPLLMWKQLQVRHAASGLSSLQDPLKKSNPQVKKHIPTWDISIKILDCWI
jgi:uncharacterized membrane protein